MLKSLRSAPRIDVSVVLAFLLMAHVGSASAADMTDRESAAAAKRFVQSFYDWYVPLGGDYEKAIKTKPAYFDQKLLAALKRDIAASDKCRGDIVGLDYDPFLQAQDVGWTYKASNVDKWRDGYRVSVQLVPDNNSRSPGGPVKGSSLYAHVAYKSGRWVFVDFENHAHSGVLQNLAVLENDRDKHPC